MSLCVLLSEGCFTFQDTFCYCCTVYDWFKNRFAVNIKALSCLCEVLLSNKGHYNMTAFGQHISLCTLVCVCLVSMSRERRSFSWRWTLVCPQRFTSYIRSDNLIKAVWKRCLSSSSVEISPPRLNLGHHCRGTASLEYVTIGYRYGR